MMYRFFVGIGLFLLISVMAIGCYKSSKRDSDELEPEHNYGTDSAESNGVDDSELEATTDNPSNPASETLTGISWVALPPSTFMMGSPPDEIGHQVNERLHEVTLTHSFEIAATEVTIGQWKKLGFDIDPGIENDFTVSPSHPVTRFGQEELNAWLDQLSVSNGLTPCYSGSRGFPSPYHCPGYRLPTEAEWEYAARAGTKTATYAGDPTEWDTGELLEDIAWCCQHPHEAYLEVGSKEPNAFGLYDMLGNVVELAEWEGVYPSGKTVNPFYFAGDVDSAERLLAARGGGYSSRRCRAAERHAFNLQEVSVPYGFRPVRTLPGSEFSNSEPNRVCQESAGVCLGNLMDLTTPLVKADNIGPGAEFVTMSKPNEIVHPELLGVVSTEKGAQTFWAQVGTTPGEPIEQYPLPELESVRLVALVQSGIPSPLSEGQFFAVLCEGDSCLLWSRDEKLTNGTFPLPIAPRAAAGLPDGVVVVGDGILVYQSGEWTVGVHPSGFRPFNAVATLRESNAAVAVGDTGRITVWEGGSWVEVESDLEENLLDVTVVGKLSESPRFIAVGEAGRIVTGWDGLIETSCVYSDSNFLKVTDNGTLDSVVENIDYYILDDTGLIYFFEAESSGSPLCALQLSLPEPILDLGASRCGFSKNLQVLTKTALYGNYDCSISK